MTIQDQVIGALACWRENRGGGAAGMQSVINVLQNRAKRRGTDIYTEATRVEQFSSLTSKGDPELSLWPASTDPQWQIALGLAQEAADGTLVDITDGADLYYAPASIKTNAQITLPNGTTIPFPKNWNKNAVSFTTTIQHQVFFKSV